MSLSFPHMGGMNEFYHLAWLQVKSHFRLNSGCIRALQETTKQKANIHMLHVSATALSKATR